MRLMEANDDEIRVQQFDWFVAPGLDFCIANSHLLVFARARQLFQTVTCTTFG